MSPVVLWLPWVADASSDRGAIIRLPAFAPPHTSHLVRHLVSICYSLKMYFWTLLPQAYMFLIIPRTWSHGIYGNTKYFNLPHYYIDKSVRGGGRSWDPESTFLSAQKSAQKSTLTREHSKKCSRECSKKYSRPRVLKEVLKRVLKKALKKVLSPESTQKSDQRSAQKSTLVWEHSKMYSKKWSKTTPAQEYSKKCSKCLKERSRKKVWASGGKNN